MTSNTRSRASQVLPRIKAMEIGDEISFPIEWLDTVRTQTSKVNTLYMGNRVTRLDRINRKIHVIRNS